jgi:hypothetical protein
MNRAFCDVTVSMLSRSVQRVRVASSATASVRTMYVRRHATAPRAPATATTRIFAPAAAGGASSSPSAASRASFMAAVAPSSVFGMQRAAASSSTLLFARGAPLTMARRQQATSTDKDGAKAAEEGKAEEGAKAEEDAEGKATEDKEGGTEPKTSVVDNFKKDFEKFPDIYNSANAFNFVLFTIFCLASTGSQIEADWWLEQWGIDKDFKPFAWLSHSVFCNNFLSMAFAMIMLHSMMHPIMNTLGSMGLLAFLSLVSVASGITMWGGAKFMDYSAEKQFGPWDIVAALFVAQYMHLGFAPWTIMLSFNGWVKYACCFGGVVICYYDWQPLLCGTVFGWLLITRVPQFRALATAAKAA